MIYQFLPQNHLLYSPHPLQQETQSSCNLPLCRLQSIRINSPLLRDCFRIRTVTSGSIEMENRAPRICCADNCNLYTPCAHTSFRIKLCCVTFAVIKCNCGEAPDLLLNFKRERERERDDFTSKGTQRQDNEIIVAGSQRKRCLALFFLIRKIKTITGTEYYL